MHPHTSRLNLSTTSLLIAAAIGLAAPLSRAHAQCVTSFASATNFNGSTGSYSITTADLNADGKLDLVFANPATSNVVALLGNGSGGFTVSGSYLTGSNPTSVSIGDVNGDGKADLVVTNAGSNFLSVLRGNGNGTFQSPTSVNTGTNFSTSALVDFNGDGRLDIVIANTTGPVQVLIGNGDGTYGTGTNYQASPFNSWPMRPVTGDFNGDGRPDIAVANYQNGSVAVLLNIGSGNFAASVNYPVGSGPTSVAVADLNGDGRLDLVTSNLTAGNASVLLGNANGTFAAAVNYPAGAGATFAALGDFNGDGRLDLAVANDGANTVSVLPGGPGGTFGAATTFAARINSSTLVVGDFNSDGRKDLIGSALSGTEPFWLLVNNSAGAPTPVITQQPIGRVAAVGSFVELTTTVNTFQAQATYRWKKNGAFISDGDIIWGAATPTLTISSLSASDTASYELQVSTPSCNEAQNIVTSMPAVIAVTVPTAPVIPANDGCSSPQPLSGNGTFTFSTANATNDGPAENNLGFCCNDNQIHKDVWFIYTATCTGAATFNLCGSGFDTKIAIYSGTACPAGPNTAIAGNDDNGICTPAGDRSAVTFNVVAGRQYLVRVGGYNGASGNVVMNVSCDGSGCLAADMGIQGGTAGRDGQLDNNDFIVFINNFFSHTGCP